MQLRFAKMHGLGNDFMVLDLLTQSVDLTPALVAQWGDRHTGVGFDQLLTLRPPTDPETDFRWDIYNTDGSTAQQCGNGARCMAKFVHDEQLSPKPSVRLHSSGGVFATKLLNEHSAEVNMGQPIVEHARIPFQGSGAQGAGAQGAGAALEQLNTDQGDFDLVPLSMGNPHGVTFVDNIVHAPVAEVGALLSQHAAFPEGANIGFCQMVDPSFMRLRVFERGVGETQACGSGACAAVTAAISLGKADARVKVSLPGGKVKIYWPGPGNDLIMTGPVATVYSGTIEV